MYKKCTLNSTTIQSAVVDEEKSTKLKYMYYNYSIITFVSATPCRASVTDWARFALRLENEK